MKQADVLHTELLLLGALVLQVFAVIVHILALIIHIRARQAEHRSAQQRAYDDLEAGRDSGWRRHPK